MIDSAERRLIPHLGPCGLIGCRLTSPSPALFNRRFGMIYGEKAWRAIMALSNVPENLHCSKMRDLWRVKGKGTGSVMCRLHSPLVFRWGTRIRTWSGVIILFPVTELTFNPEDRKEILLANSAFDHFTIRQYSSLGSQPILCGSIPGLVPKQLRFCRNYIEIMPSVAEGVKLGIQECQHQFRGRRWNCTTIDDSLAIFGPVLDKGPPIRYSENLHKKVGNPNSLGIILRKTILDHMHLKCKCHGLSGSCEVKTCWWAQPDFRAIGDYLKDKYDSASEMVVEKHRESRGWVETLRAKYALFKPPTERDLVYYENSPNFCEPNPETGSFGTRDRTCNVTSHGIDGCDLLCCGRGHNTRTEKRKEKCHCIFHWCCYVSCQECIRVYDVHTCK
ncbi:hypothetical protein ASZ78_003958 [Callipepla squamata]|uniref:Protein Wnt n=1 Tax=Callipepla squamata TaxID=9009 RepID=A0A226MN06_CALSU|nr:hypothetical protein ASZ78_003958 [Callipepla squamata]